MHMGYQCGFERELFVSYTTLGGDIAHTPRLVWPPSPVCNAACCCNHRSIRSITFLLSGPPSIDKRDNVFQTSATQYMPQLDLLQNEMYMSTQKEKYMSVPPRCDA